MPSTGLKIDGISVTAAGRGLEGLDGTCFILGGRHPAQPTGGRRSAQETLATYVTQPLTSGESTK
jgi:hypothetical protein